ncbi:MAG: PH domain-containing protein [Gammaproteobacteria bacterium]
MRQTIQPAGSWTVLTLIGIGVLISGFVLVPTLVSDIEKPPLLIGLLVCLPLTALLCWLAVAQGQSFIEANHDGIQLKIPLYGRQLSWAQIDAENIQTLDLDRDSPLSLRWRTNGVGAPGYKLGWFRTRDKRKALVAVTHPKVIAIPTHDGFTIIASVTSPRALADDIKKKTNVAKSPTSGQR